VGKGSWRRLIRRPLWRGALYVVLKRIILRSTGGVGGGDGSDGEASGGGGII
jgi:hypothetical protein